LVLGTIGTKKNFITECVDIKQGKRDPITGKSFDIAFRGRRSAMRRRCRGNLLTAADEAALVEIFGDSSKVNPQWQSGEFVPLETLRNLIFQHVLGSERFSSLLEERLDTRRNCVFSDRYLSTVRKKIVERRSKVIQLATQQSTSNNDNDHSTPGI